MTDGRRRRRTRWWASGAAVVASPPPRRPAARWRSPPSAGPHPRHPARSTSPAPVVVRRGTAGRADRSCTVTRLPTDGVDKAVVTGGDPTGRWHWSAGCTGRRTGISTAGLVVWRDGRSRPGPGCRAATARSRTSTRAASGSVTASAATIRARTRTADGRIEPAKGGSEDHPTAINRTGVMVGQAGERAARWKSATAAPERLQVPGRHPGQHGHRHRRGGHDARHRGERPQHDRADRLPVARGRHR